MATLYADAAGAPLRFLANTWEEDTSGYGAPPGTVGTLLIDEITNTALIADIQAHITDYTLLSSVLRKSGNIVTVQPPAQAQGDRNGFAAIRAKLINNQVLTNPEQLTLFRILLFRIERLEARVQ